MQAARQITLDGVQHRFGARTRGRPAADDGQQERLGMCTQHHRRALRRFALRCDDVEPGLAIGLTDIEKADFAVGGRGAHGGAQIRIDRFTRRRRYARLAVRTEQHQGAVIMGFLQHAKRPQVDPALLFFRNSAWPAVLA